ncbi:MAG: alpha/beta hydrolase [Ardenticatenales bacterium]|nr:alpha/beta hydrolase [Ardenticatenales bacterium]
MDDWKQARVVLELPGMAAIQPSHQLIYQEVAGTAYGCDVYLPPSHQPGQLHPTILFVHGEGPAEILFDAKDWGQYVSWGQLAAASGFAGVTFTHRSSGWFQRLPDVEADLNACLAFLRDNATTCGLNLDQLVVWVCSGGTPAVVSTLLRNRPAGLRALIACYGRLALDPIAAQIDPPLPATALARYSANAALDELDPAGPPPLLLVRCGADELPGVNDSIDAFTAAALARNIPLELINYPAGVHGFDISNDTDAARQIIRRILTFASAQTTS